MRTHVCVCMRLYVCVPLTSGVIWTPYDWLSKGCSFYVAGVIIISSGCALRIEAHKNQPNKSKPSLYKPLLPLLTFFLSSCTYTSNKVEHFSIKVGGRQRRLETITCAIYFCCGLHAFLYKREESLILVQLYL